MVHPGASNRDPVCGMNVVLAESRHSTTYRGRVLHFCSEQCQERFLANPDLYAGAPLRRDIHPLPKRRHLRLVRGDATAIATACATIRDMMGITSVFVSAGQVEVEYDLRQATLAQIEAVASAAGGEFRRGAARFAPRPVALDGIQRAG